MIESLVQFAVNTTRVDSWAEQIDEIGPMYPFVGWEWLMFLIAVAIVVYWIASVYVLERKTYREDIEQYGDTLSMAKIVKGDHYSLSRTDVPKVDVEIDIEKK